jgi:hypothetical protein
MIFFDMVNKNRFEVKKMTAEENKTLARQFFYALDMGTKPYGTGSAFPVCAAFECAGLDAGAMETILESFTSRFPTRSSVSKMRLLKGIKLR